MTRLLTWRDRMEHERLMSKPPCPECRMRSFHKIECSKWEPVQSLGYYAELAQRQHYRESVRDLGCTCHDRMPPHTHGLTCSLYQEPADA
jgi:hypothetical protein